MNTSSIVDFAKPPLTEVVLSVQFEPLESLNAPLIGLLWSEYRANFPRVQQLGPIDHVIETFGGMPKRRRSIQIEVFDMPPPMRFWFVADDDSELIQVQSDRLIHNWRKVKDEGVYPRYGKIRAAFKDQLQRFDAFLKHEKVGHLLPDQCEVSYINQIVPNSEWSKHSDIAKVFNGIDPQTPSNLIFEDAAFSQRSLIVNQNQPIGRLHCSVQSSFLLAEGTPIFVLNLTARLAPTSPNIESVMEALDMGRQHVIDQFMRITKPTMHHIWGLETR